MACVLPSLSGLGTVLLALSVTSQSALAAGAPTMTILAVSSGGAAVTSVASGAVVTLTATVTASGSSVNPGTVKFCNAAAIHCTDSALLGSAQLTPGGTATYRFRPGIGAQSYKAIFVGTTSYTSSTSSASTVTATGTSPSSAAIAQSGSAASYTLTATVTGDSTAFPTGVVSFLDASNSNAVLGAGTLVAGTSSVSYSGATPAAGPVSFSTVPTPNFVCLVEVADFNGDGIPDLAVTQYGDSPLAILQGKGDGTFTLASTPSLSTTPSSVLVGDFNGDGIPDLAVTYYVGQTATLTILKGNGDGSFTALPGPATGYAGLAVGDFNGDGLQDLVIANNGYIEILQGNGDGTFSALASTSTVGGAVAVADFNGDGIQDLAVTNSSANTVTILQGKGDGTFTALASLPAGMGPALIVVLDFNGDGKPDLAVLNVGPFYYVYGDISILKGNGDGTFTSLPGLQLGGTMNHSTEPRDLAVADLNGDGIPDLVVVESYSGIARVLQGNGDGTFTGAGGVGTKPNADGSSGAGKVAVGDFNGDGVPDLAIGDIFSAPASISLSSRTATATATSTGISVAGDGSVHNVYAGYVGDSSYSASVSTATGLTSVANTGNPTGPSGYTYCAPENGTCNITSLSSVAYGANGAFNYGNFSAAVSCSNSVFGDPVFGAVKACFYKVASTTLPVGPSGYTYCALENGTCNITSLSSVAFGANGAFNYGEFSSAPTCSNTVFGDPIFGTVKSCFYKPVDPSVDPSFSLCAAENGICSFSGTATVAYGVDGAYNYGTFTTSVSCSNSVFTDPYSGVVKACYYRPD